MQEMRLLDVGNLSHHLCPQCDMLVTWKAPNRWNVITDQCDKGAERKRWRLAEEEIRESAERTFQAYSRHLATVTLFKYLGWILMAADKYWPIKV